MFSWLPGEKTLEFYHRKDSELSGAQSKLNLPYMYFDLHKGEKHKWNSYREIFAIIIISMIDEVGQSKYFR